MTAAPVRLERHAFKTSRLLDFVGRRELTAQIGHEPSMWPLVVLKEALDNALDACEEAGIAPIIKVEVSTEAGEAMISVTDNGPGMAPETVTDILDFSTRTSSREAYCGPTRGAQGNALKTIVALPYALGDRCAETQIESRGIWHRITFTADAVQQVPRIKHESEPNDHVVQNGASITVFWPDSACSYLEVRKAAFLQMCAGYAVLNPHVGLTVRWDGEVFIQVSASDKGWVKWRSCNPDSPHWYTPQRLARLAAAHVARGQDQGRIPTLREFIAEFCGLSRSATQKVVAEECGLARQPLAALFNDGSVNEALIAALLRAMQRHSRTVKPRALGVIAAEHLREFCIAAKCVAETFKYRVIMGETRDGIPFVVEAAFAAAPESDQARRLVLGVNFASSLGNPFRSLQGSYFDGLETRLADQRCSSREPVVVILHLACARVEYQDRGKSSVVLGAAISTAIESAIDTVTGPWAKQRKAEERDQSRRARRMDRLVAKPVNVSVRAAAWEVMAAAYAKASDSGRLPTKPRQIMYAARPAILDMTGKDSFGDQYFTQTLLNNYIDAHPAECASWDIIWDARGNFVEPHTGLKVPLGTQEVRQYLERAVPTGPAPITISINSGYPTVGPEQRYDTVLFVEKEGFNPLFERVRLAERFDAAITSTKGMSVTAVRMLLEQLYDRGVKRVLVLHDFDISGFSIFGTLGKSGRRYRFKNELPLIDIGLRLVQVEAMGLQSEPVAIEKNEWEKRARTLKQHGATADEIEFLRDRRVELNAMTSPQLVEFIEEQFALYGVAKLVPSDSILEKHARHLIEQRLARDAFEQLRTDFAEQARTASLPADLRTEVEAVLDDNPAMPWDVALARAITRRRDQ